MADKRAPDERRRDEYFSQVSREIDDAIGAVLTQHQGRAFLWWLLEIGRVQQQPFSSSPDRTAFNCGELNVGQQILARIVEVDPDGYLAMMKEKANERRNLDNPGTGGDSGSRGNGLPGGYDVGAAEPPEHEE